MDWIQALILGVVLGLTEYLAGGNYASAPMWDVDELRSRLGIVFTERARRLIDAGGRPVES